MTDRELLQRILSSLEVLLGKPVIKETRLSVDYILNLLAHGTTTDELLKEYDGLTAQDTQACLLFASQSLANTAFMPVAESA